MLWEHIFFCCCYEDLRSREQCMSCDDRELPAWSKWYCYVAEYVEE